VRSKPLIPKLSEADEPKTPVHERDCLGLVTPGRLTTSIRKFDLFSFVSAEANNSFMSTTATPTL